MNTRTLTSANAKLLIGVQTVFPTMQQIAGFSTDDMTDVDSISPKEVAMGIDGRLSAGFVPMPVTQNITLQADSGSIEFFEQWFQYEQQTRETYYATGQLHIPGQQKAYAMTRGVLTGYVPFSALRKTAQPRRFSIVWQSVTAAPSL